MKKINVFKLFVGLFVLMSVNSVFAEVCRTRTNQAWKAKVYYYVENFPSENNIMVDFSTVLPGGKVEGSAEYCANTATGAVRGARIWASQRAADHLANKLSNGGWGGYLKWEYTSLVCAKLKNSDFKNKIYVVAIKGFSYTNLVSPEWEWSPQYNFGFTCN